MSGKGSALRPAAVPEAVAAERWQNVFGLKWKGCPGCGVRIDAVLPTCEDCAPKEDA